MNSGILFVLLFMHCALYLDFRQAFPSISTGIYSYPIEDATRIALDTTRTFLESERGSKVGQFTAVIIFESHTIDDPSDRKGYLCGVEQ